MTGAAVSDTLKTGLLAAGWYTNRIRSGAFPGVLALCYHGVRESARHDRDTPFANLHVLADTFDAPVADDRRDCHPIDLATFCDARATAAPLPDRPVLITRRRLPQWCSSWHGRFLRRYRSPATVFVCSDAAALSVRARTRRAGPTRPFRGSERNAAGTNAGVPRRIWPR